MGMAEIISLFSRNSQIIHDQLRYTCKSACPLHATCLIRSTCFRSSPPSISSYPVIQVQVLLGVPAPRSSTPLPHSLHTSLSWEAGQRGSLRSNLSSPTQRFLRKNHGPRTIFNILFHFSLKPPSFSKYPQQKRYEILNAAKMYTSAICWIHLIFLKWKHLWKEIWRQKSYNPYHK